MAKFIKLILLLFVVVLFGCGTQSGGASSSSTSSSDTSDSSSDDTSSESTVVDVETDIEDGTDDVQSLTDLGGSLTDLGDLVGSTTNTWWYAHAYNVSSDGYVVGQTNAGSPVKAGFLWDPNTTDMTYLGIHSGLYDDFYGIEVDNSSTNYFIYSEGVSVVTIAGSRLVLGNSTTGADWPEESEKRAFLFDSSSGSFYDLAPPAYTDSNGDWVFKSFSEAVQINFSGQILINADDEDGTHAYYWDGSTTQSITFTRSDSTTGTVIQPSYRRLGRIIGEDSEGVAINNNGQAVVNSGGTAVFEDLNDNAIEVLNFFPEESETTAVDLNESGHVVGVSGNEGFFWRGGSMYPMGHLGGGSSEAVDLNNNDQVAANSTLNSSGDTHAVVWSLVDGRGKMVDLGTLGGTNSYAVAINDAGQVIGYSETGETYEEGGQSFTVVHGFLWQNGVMYDLGTHHDFYDYPYEDVSFPMSETAAISENGDIVGNSLSINEHSRGFYLQVDSDE